MRGVASISQDLSTRVWNSVPLQQVSPVKMINFPNKVKDTKNMKQFSIWTYH